MSAAAELLWDDDLPPPSGVRVHALAVTMEPQAAPNPGPAVPVRIAPRRGDVLPELMAEVVLEVWGLVRVLSPLQGAWFDLGPRQAGAALATMTAWACAPRPEKVLRERWPELVPGHAAMDRLVRVMVDHLC